MDFLSKAGLSACKPEQDLKFASDAGELLDDPSTYRRLVGSLFYLTNYRPDIAYTYNIGGSDQPIFMDKPRSSHLEAAFRILRYIKTSPGRG